MAIHHSIPGAVSTGRFTFDKPVPWAAADVDRRTITARNTYEVLAEYHPPVQGSLFGAYEFRTSLTPSSLYFGITATSGSFWANFVGYPFVFVTASNTLWLDSNGKLPWVRGFARREFEAIPSGNIGTCAQLILVDSQGNNFVGGESVTNRTVPYFLTSPARTDSDNVIQQAADFVGTPPPGIFTTVRSTTEMGVTVKTIEHTSLPTVELAASEGQIVYASEDRYTLEMTNIPPDISPAILGDGTSRFLFNDDITATQYIFEAIEVVSVDKWIVDILNRSSTGIARPAPIQFF